VSILLYRKEELLSQKEKDLLKAIKENCPDIGTAQLLAHKFRDMIEHKQGHLLNNWMDEVQKSSIRELGFARGLMTDYTAVCNGISLPWSNRQVEGKINKLNNIKRQMY
jgi:transposase